MIELVREGDELAFKKVYDQKKEKVYFFFLKKTSSEEDSKDLMQNTFLKLWQHRKSLSSNYVLDQYLFSIAKTVFIDHLRKKASLREKEKLNYQHNLREQQCFSQEETALQFLLTDAACPNMPDVRKKVFLMHKMQGYSYKEISEMLSIPVKSVDNHLSKALRQFRELF